MRSLAFLFTLFYSSIPFAAQVIEEEKLAKEMEMYEEQMALIDEKIKEIRQELLSIKEDLGDKTHKESVSAYRNIKSDIEELKKYIADSTDEKLLKKAAGFAEKAFVLGIINLIAILAIVSYQTGFFGLLL